MEKSVDPRIQCKGVFLTKLSFHLKDGATKADLEGQYELELHFGFKMDFPRLTNNLTVKCTNKKHPEIADIEASVMGLFEGEDKGSLELFAPNSGAILLPYLRSYIATVTGWGPMNPVMIPIMNMTKDGLEHTRREPSKELHLEGSGKPASP